MQKNIPTILIGLLCGTMVFDCSSYLNNQNRFFVFVLLIYVTYSFFYSLRHKVSFDLIDNCIILYLLFIVIFQGETLTNHLICLFALYFAIRMTEKKYVFTVFILFLSFVSIIECIIGILQIFKICTSNNDYFCITGTFFNPGPYGCFLSILGVLSLLYALSIRSFSVKNKKLKNKFDILYWYYLYSAILAIVMIILSGSRTALFSFIVTIFFYYIKEIYMLKRKN